MRPQQQNRRMRGRNNNNNNNNRGGGGGGKGGPNPLTRSYESNGPDVKIRGNAQQIAEKYAALARDAQSSGDRVMAENYLQHAEHYNRIIAAAHASMPIQNQQSRDDFDDEDGEERDDFDAQGNGDQQPNGDGYGSGPQPVIDGVPAEVALNGDTNGNGENGQNRNENRNREFRNNNRDRNRDRNRDNQNRNNGNGDYQRRDYQQRDDQRQDGQSQDAARHDNQRRDVQPRIESNEEFVPGDSLPAFVTGGTQPVEAAIPPREEAPRKTRRPRRGEQANADAPQEPQPAAPAEVLVAQDD